MQFLPGIRRPMILSLEKPAARAALSTHEFSYWLRASKELPVNRTDSNVKSHSASWSSGAFRASGGRRFASGPWNPALRTAEDVAYSIA